MSDKILFPVSEQLLSDKVITISVPRWIDVEEELPDDSRAVLITDGVDISTAHYFRHRYHPEKNKPEEEWKDDGPAWVNQHDRLTGGYIEEPSHWMEIKNLLLLPT